MKKILITIEALIEDDSKLELVSELAAEFSLELISEDLKISDAWLEDIAIVPFYGNNK